MRGGKERRVSWRESGRSAKVTLGCIGKEEGIWPVEVINESANSNCLAGQREGGRERVSSLGCYGAS